MPKVSDEHLAARRRQILDAALVRFSEQGFRQTPMQAIFEEADLSPGAVYRYFRSKEEIVVAIVQETLRGFAQSLAPERDGPGLRPDEVLDRLIDALEGLELREERMRLAVQVWSESLHNPEVAGVLRERVEELRSRIAADLRAAADPDDTARVILAIAQGYILQRNWFEDAEGFRGAARALLSQAQPASRPLGSDGDGLTKGRR